MAIKNIKTLEDGRINSGEGEDSGTEEGIEARGGKRRGQIRGEEQKSKCDVHQQKNSSDEHHSDGSSLWRQIMKLSQDRNIN